MFAPNPEQFGVAATKFFEGGSAPKWKATSGDFGKTLGNYRSQIATALEELGGGDA